MNSRALLPILAVSLAAVLAGCGGGGGDSAPAVGGGPTTSTTAFRVTLDRGSVAFTQVAGAVAPAEVLTAVGTGTPPSQLYVGAVAEGPAIDPGIALTISGMTAQASIRPKAGLAPGDYAGRVLFLVCTDVNCAQQVAGSPLIIAYSVKVLPTLETASPLIVVGAETNPSVPLRGAVRIDAPAGSPPFQWSVVDSDSWVRVTRGSGASGTDLEYEINWGSVNGMPNDFEQTALIRLTTTRPNEVAHTVAVRVRKALPTLDSATPSRVVAMRTTRIVLRGRNFDGLVSLASRIQITGGTLVGAAKLSDKALLADIAPNLLGDMQIRVLNAQGVATMDARVEVIPPREYTYATIDAPGLKRSAVLDPETHSVFVANTELQMLQKFRPNGLNWGVDSLPVPNLFDVGLSRNGFWLVATTRLPNPVLHNISPLTLLISTSTPVTGSLGGGDSAIGNGIPSTNDGRMWLGLGDGVRNGVAYYDPSNNKLETLVPGTSGAFPLAEGPWYSVAGNGERLLAVFGVNGNPDMHYLDASDGSLKRAGTGLGFRRTSTSDAGDRVLYDAGTVRDANFGLIGTLSLSGEAGNPVAVGGSLSRDGRRAYIVGVGSLPNLWVYVYDTSVISLSGTLLPIARFEVADAPSCRPGPSCPSPWVIVKTAVDSNTLFLVGNERVVAQPIPPAQRSAGPPLQALQIQAQPQTRILPLGGP